MAEELSVVLEAVEACGRDGDVINHWPGRILIVKNYPQEGRATVQHCEGVRV